MASGQGKNKTKKKKKSKQWLDFSAATWRWLSSFWQKKETSKKATTLGKIKPCVITNSKSKYVMYVSHFTFRNKKITYKKEKKTMDKTTWKIF